MVSFVILHYKSIDETLECLNCLKSTFNENEYSAIVVDNNSLLEEEVNKIKEFTKDIILLKDNIGFAKANNIGCKYAIEKYNPSFIAVINNDVFIKQRDFINIIEEDYKKYQFDMLGPWIDSTTGDSCNPFPVIYGKEKIEQTIEKNKKLVRIYNNPFMYFLLNVYLNVKHTIKKPKVPTNAKDLKKNIALHGCSVIFSKKYYEKYDSVFFNETFLFHEEEFLYNRMIKDNLVSIYDPKLKIFHKEGSSLNKSGNKRLAKLFKTKEKIKSLELLLKEI